MLELNSEADCIKFDVIEFNSIKFYRDSLSRSVQQMKFQYGAIELQSNSH